LGSLPELARPSVITARAIATPGCHAHDGPLLRGSKREPDSVAVLKVAGLPVGRPDRPRWSERRGDRGSAVDTQDIPAELKSYFDSSHIALALAAVTEDNPLLLVNAPFHRLTGYDAADVVGRNCRLLQRDAENREARAKIRAFLEEDRIDAVRTTIVNFRKDGRSSICCTCRS